MHVTTRLRSATALAALAACVATASPTAAAAAAAEPKQIFARGANPSAVVEAGGIAYFTATTGLPGATGLYRTDGTPAGTRRVFDPAPGKFSEVRDLTAVGDTLYFISCPHSALEKCALWKTKGSEQDTRPAFAANLPGATAIRGVAGASLFTETQSSGTATLRRLDPKTGRLEQIKSGAGSYQSFLSTPDGSVYFVHQPSVADDPSLWRLAPSASEPVQIAARIGSGSPAAAGNRVYFFGVDDAHGHEPWLTDGTAAGTRLVQDMISGPASAYSTGLTSVGDAVYANIQPSNQYSDLTTVPYLHLLTDRGALPVTDHGSIIGAGSNTPGVVGNTLIVGGFRGSGGPGDTGLWAVDAGATSARPLPGPSSTSSVLSTPAGLYLVSEPDAKLWRVDGTYAGSRVVTQLTPGTNYKANPSPAIANLGYAGGHLYFTRETSTAGFHLWRTDGTAESEQLVTPPGLVGVVAAQPSIRAVNSSDRSAPYRYTLRGLVSFPDLADAEALCTGSAKIAVARRKSGQQIVARTTAKLRFSGGVCGYSAGLTLPSAATKRSGRGELWASVTVTATDHTTNALRHISRAKLRYGR